MQLLLKTHDLAVTKSYYRDRLGFSVRDTDESTCTVEIQGQALIFTEAELWPGAPMCTGTVYLSVDDVDAYYASVEDIDRCAVASGNDVLRHQGIWLEGLQWVLSGFRSTNLTSRTCRLLMAGPDVGCNKEHAYPTRNE